MFSLVLPSFLVLVHWSCARAEEVTHMPDVEELTLPPHIVKVMQNAEVMPHEDCKNHMKSSLTKAMDTLDKAVRESYGKGKRGVPLEDMTPCSRCRLVNHNFKLINVENLIVYQYLKESYILDAYLRVPKVHLECDNCVLTDNGGKQHTGDFDIIWTKPLINLLAEDVYETFGVNGDWVKFLKFNGMNINRDAFHVTCKGGDETFKEVCKSSDESGELDRVMHAASERLFKFEEKDFPHGYLRQIAYDHFTVPINEAFHCSIGY